MIFRFHRRFHPRNIVVSGRFMTRGGFCETHFATRSVEFIHHLAKPLVLQLVREQSLLRRIQPKDVL